MTENREPASLDARLMDLERRIASFDARHSVEASAGVRALRYRVELLRMQIDRSLTRGELVAAVTAEFERDFASLAAELTALIGRVGNSNGAEPANDVIESRHSNRG